MLRIDASRLTDSSAYWWRKPLRGKPRWIWPIIGILILYGLCSLVGCTPRTFVIQPKPVQEPSVSKPLEPAKPPGYFSHRMREILGEQ